MKFFKSSILCPCLAVVLFLISSSARAQVDSVKVFYPDKKYTQAFVDSLMKFPSIPKDYKVVNKIFKENEHLLGRPYMYLSNASRSFRVLEDMDSVLYYTGKAIEAFETAPVQRDIDEEQLVRVYTVQGRAQWEIEDFPNSIQSYQKALDLTKKYPYKWKGFITTGLAGNQFKIGNDSIALHYFELSRQDTNYMSIPRSASHIYNSLGYIHNSFGNSEMARTRYMQGIAHAFETGYMENLHSLYFNMGHFMLEREKQDSALYYYKKGSAAAVQYGLGTYRNGPIHHKKVDAFIAMHEGKLDVAISAFKEVLAELDSRELLNKDDRDVYLFCSEHLVTAYERKGNFAEANKVLKNQHEFLMDFRQFEIDTEIQRFEVSYQTKEKDASIERLRAQNLAQDTILRQRSIITWGVVGLSMLLGIAGYLVYRKRRADEKYRLISLEQRLLRSQLNPHFMFNTLSVIQNNLEQDPNKAKKYIVKFSRLLASIFENSAFNYIALEKELETITQYMDLQQIRFGNNFTHSIELNGINEDMVFIPAMLLQPVVENSISHGFNGIDYHGEITIRFTQASAFIVCEIEDNGRGLLDKAETSNRASSTRLIADFLNGVKGASYSVQDKKETSQDESGVIVTFTIPYKTTLDD